MFVFCCYTGLSYVDVEKLNPKDIQTGLDGELGGEDGNRLGTGAECCGRDEWRDRQPHGQNNTAQQRLAPTHSL